MSHDGGISLIENARLRASELRGKKDYKIADDVEFIAMYATELRKAVCQARDAILSMSRHGFFEQELEGGQIWGPALTRTYELVGEPDELIYARELANGYESTNAAPEDHACPATMLGCTCGRS
jgi:hypothetical protein